MAMIGSVGGFIGLMGLSGLVSLGFLLWVGCTPSQSGPNQYGSVSHPQRRGTRVSLNDATGYEADEYRSLFPAFIKDWRSHFNLH